MEKENIIIKKSTFPVESRIDLNTFGTFAFPIGQNRKTEIQLDGQ